MRGCRGRVLTAGAGDGVLLKSGVKRTGQLERRLPAKLDDDALGPLKLNHVQHVLHLQSFVFQGREGRAGLARVGERLTAPLAMASSGCGCGDVRDAERGLEVGCAQRVPSFPQYQNVFNALGAQKISKVM